LWSSGIGNTIPEVATVAARVPASATLVPYAEGVESPRDPCAVETRGLASVVASFVAEYGRRHKATSVVGEDVLTGAIQELVRRTADIDPAGKGVSDKTIRSVLKGTYETTDLRTADALVTAARRPMAFHDGTLGVVRNHRAEATIRTTCCGGGPWSGWAAPTIENYRKYQRTGEAPEESFDALTGAA
jgi:hypothetical protein